MKAALPYLGAKCLNLWLFLWGNSRIAGSGQGYTSLEQYDCDNFNKIVALCCIVLNIWLFLIHVYKNILFSLCGLFLVL